MWWRKAAAGKQSAKGQRKIFYILSAQKTRVSERKTLVFLCNSGKIDRKTAKDDGKTKRITQKTRSKNIHILKLHKSKINYM